MFNTINIEYQATDDVDIATQWLLELNTYPLSACDFEVAIKYTKQELDHFKHIVETSSNKLEVVKAQSCLDATALDHPSHCKITHFTIAVSETEGYCFILNSPELTDLVLDYITNSEQVQIWHNASYDFRHIYYHTNKFPLNYEDTMILAKTLVNHVDTWKANVGLKELAGTWYGDWAISADNFTLEQMYEPHVLKYATTDACATFKLWHFIQAQCDEIDVQITKELDGSYNGDWL